jgi:glycosyltransferase involved in cell wall biosynthesis
MSDTPKLSIGVPSRNRQPYFQQTIRDLLRDPRSDIEFVFADNSDDPSIMNDFMAGIDDPRVRYIPSVDRCLPMEDNWERVAGAANGDWISIIGDDDYIDTGLPDILAEIVRREPQTEVVGWSRLTYNWPGYRVLAGNMSLQMGNRAARFGRQQLIRGMFLWENAGHVPSNPFTIYHGAVRRSFALTLRKRFGGRFFEHPVVDYEYACKIVHSARHVIYVERPLSVLGACPKSNSAAIGNFETSLANYRALVAETGGGEEMSAWMDGFPFNAPLGVAGSIMGTQHWFKQKYSFPVEGWEENFIAALERDCRRAETRRLFDMQVELCRLAISAWKGGRFSQHFNPLYVERMNAPIYTGMLNNTLYIDEKIGDAATPAALLDIVRGIVDLPQNIAYGFGDTSNARPVDAGLSPVS